MLSVVINQKNNINQKKMVFKGHLGFEKYTKEGIAFLRKETCFFRDFETKDFVKRYIMGNLGDKNRIKILVGGCSTGEEAYSYSMMLDNIKDKVSILGFDLSADSIQIAKSGKLFMQKPDKFTEFLIELSGIRYDAFDDAFLCFKQRGKITPRQSLQKHLFNKFFNVGNDVKNTDEKNIFKRIWNLFQLNPNLKTKNIELKAGQAQNCSFMQGDILDLSSINNGEKADVITFSNALYHLITREIPELPYRVLKVDADDTLHRFSQIIRENLNEKGLLVFGEDEQFQIMDCTSVPAILTKEGFVPQNCKNKYAANIWQKK